MRTGNDMLKNVMARNVSTHGEPKLLVYPDI